MSAHRHLAWGDGRLRVTRWRGDDSTAQIVATRGHPTAAAIAELLEELARDGCHAAVTAALPPSDHAPFLEAGFTVHERLHLLNRSVEEPPSVDPLPVVLRRGRRVDREAILELDGATFQPFWHFDGPGLDDALAATPSSRLRVAVAPDAEPVLLGYAITGRAGQRGYLQRLAVDPARQRRGIGTALVADGLRWLKRWGAHEVLVNTQVGNESALALYEALGFRRQPEGLAVLRHSLGATNR